MRVLLVDDSPAVVASLSRLLGVEPGVEVVGWADDLASALSRTEQVHPDLVLLDVDLAHGDRGYDLLLRLRREHADVAVVVLSNFGGQALRNAFLGAGADAYFDKSLEFGRALDWVRHRARTDASGSPRA
jgi:DNA-binding NarL/FixJ family response regulator